MVEENHASLKPERKEVVSHVCGLEKLVNDTQLFCKIHLLQYIHFMVQQVELETVCFIARVSYHRNR